MKKELTHEQTLAVKRLERAFKACRDANVTISNRYGYLHAFNGHDVVGVGFMSDPPREGVLDCPVNECTYDKEVKTSGYDLISLCDDDCMHGVFVYEAE